MGGEMNGVLYVIDQLGNALAQAQAALTQLQEENAALKAELEAATSKSS